MKMVNCKCEQCGVVYQKSLSQFRARPARFCSLKCAGKFKAIGKDEVRRRHAEYLKEKMKTDVEFRRRRLEQKRRYYQSRRDHFLALGKKYRQASDWQEKHNEYCRRPEYVKNKKKYDRNLRCLKKYGDFAEAASILIDIESLLRPHKYEIRKTNGTLNKAIQRSRNEKVKRSYT